MNKPKMSFNEATRTYVHRYTAEHIPRWADVPTPNGKYYAPQFLTDKEWYDSTLFPPHNPFHSQDCHSNGQTWPLGQWLDKPLRPYVNREDFKEYVPDVIKRLITDRMTEDRLD